MKGDAQIIKILNRALNNELMSINQYVAHALMLKNWGLNKIGSHMYREAIEEMKHAESLIERILLLEGAPEMKSAKPRIGKDVPTIFENDMGLEFIGVKDLREGIKLCEEKEDFVSRDLLQSILAVEEQHIDWLETQQELIKSLGLENYLQSAAGEVAQQ